LKQKKFRYFVGDFETTVYKGQVATEVWASASVEFYTEDVNIFHSLDEQFEYFKSLKDNVVVYFHNLKFDGGFWLPYLLQEHGFKQAYTQIDQNNPFKVEWLQEREMKNNTFKYSISDKGMWYTIIIKVNDKYIEIRDSLKLLPFSVKRIGKSFGTKHKKLDMKYKGFRYAGCVITEEEKKYIANDVLVIKEALEIMFNEGHTDLTIGSCCLNEFKDIYGKEDYEMFFPDMYSFRLDKSVYGCETAGDYIRKSYRGGWCYLVKGKEKKRHRNGTTADVNSLYPSMMHSESGNRYPVGKPHFWSGNIIPDEALKENRYYFIRIRTRFYIKENMLPFIQIKHSFLYRGTEALETTDVLNKQDGKYYSQYIDKDGTLKDTRTVLTLTMTDFILLKEHYELVDFEILDGCWFFSEIGLFDSYIDKYKEMKLNNEGALRELAKLFLNNLYGKMASSKDSSFKIAYVKEDGSLGFMLIAENNKKAGYIPIGSAITSYARNFTIRAAQKNYHGVNARGFIYADTDSIHCDIEPEEFIGIKVHNKNFCCWKLESYWDEAYFTRQKTYIEHVTKEQHNDIMTPLTEIPDKIINGVQRYKKPYYNVKCAGMPDKSKNIFIASMTGEIEHAKEYIEDEETPELKDEIIRFVTTKRELENFNIGLKVPGKLRPLRIKGGIILTETPYEMR
jgi:hypothetical protein